MQKAPPVFPEVIKYMASNSSDPLINLFLFFFFFFLLYGGEGSQEIVYLYMGVASFQSSLRILI